MYTYVIYDSEMLSFRDALSLLILRHLEKIPSTIKYQFFDCPRLTDATDISFVSFFFVSRNPNLGSPGWSSAKTQVLDMNMKFGFYFLERLK